MSAMPRYETFNEQPQPPSLTKGWFISALTGSLVVHAGLAIFFNFKTLENFGPSDFPPAKAESTLHRVKNHRGQAEEAGRDEEPFSPRRRRFRKRRRN